MEKGETLILRCSKEFEGKCENEESEFSSNFILWRNTAEVEILV